MNEQNKIFELNKNGIYTSVATKENTSLVSAYRIKIMKWLGQTRCSLGHRKREEFPIHKKWRLNMLYPFMTLEDGTEIVHSEAINDKGKEKVKVVIETPIMQGFKHAECWLPDYTWSNVEGYSDKEISELESIIRKLSAIIINLARQGGFDNASGF